MVACNETVIVTYGAPPGGLGIGSCHINPPDAHGGPAVSTIGWVISTPPAWCAATAALARVRASLGSGSGYVGDEFIAMALAAARAPSRAAASQIVYAQQTTNRSSPIKAAITMNMAVHANSIVDKAVGRRDSFTS